MNRNYKLDNIRALAILVVVFGHSIILYSSSWDLYEPARTCAFLDYAKRLINIVQMPLFFSLSGYLLSVSRSKGAYLPFLAKKFVRLIIPFAFAGLCFMIPLKMFLGYHAYIGKSYLDSAIMLLLGQESGHLWYLPSLFLIFAVAYWIVRISNHCPWVLLFAFIGSIFLKHIRYQIPDLGIPYQYLAMEHLWAFLLGCVINTFSIEQWLKKYKYIFVAASILLCIYNIIYNRTDLLVSMLTVVSVYVWMPNRKNEWLYKLSKDSFGIYLLHSPLIYLTFTYLLNAHPVVTVGLNFFGFGSLAVFMTRAIRKSGAKLIIGE